MKEAIEEHYLFTEFAAAEHVLLRALAECEARCRRSTLARAWMYLGIVRANGLQQSKSALEAFAQAFDEDSSVALDLDLASAGTRKLWALARERSNGGSAERRASGPRPERGRDAIARPAAGSGSLQCTPRVLEALPGRQLPIACEQPAGAERLVVHYLEFGEHAWHELELFPEAAATSRAAATGRLQALLPCSATAYAGPLRFYVVALSSTGRAVESLGSAQLPLVLDVRPDASVRHALANGRAAPDCKQRQSCPPGFPCAGSGETCEVDDDCKEGLTCQKGRKAARATCQRPNAPKQKRPPAHFVGLHAGLDIVALPTQDRLCSVESQADPDRDYDCYLDSKPYPDAIGAPPTDGYAGAVDGGFSAGTLRLLASYSWRATDWLALGTRAGWALLGAPKRFMPVHLELEADYVFVADRRALLQPYASLTGGLAQVAAGIAFDVDDENRSSGVVSQQPVRAFTSAGPWFSALGVGSRLVFSEHLAVQLDTQICWLLPQQSFSLRPSLGVVVGLPEG